MPVLLITTSILQTNLFYLIVSRYSSSSMLMLNSSHQFFQQIPVVTSANLLAMLGENNRSTFFDPLAEIRNGLKCIDFLLHNLVDFAFFVARLKVASVWRRFLAEAVDFILLHVFK